MANTYLTRTFGSSPSTTLFTWSAWVKRSKLGVQQAMISGAQNSNTGQLIYFTSDDKFAYYAQAGGTVKCNLICNARLRDTNAWYHLVLVVDSSQASASDRVKFYVNNVEQSYTTTVAHVQNWDAYFMLTVPTNVGRNGMNTSDYFDGVMSHMHMTHGYNYTPSTFGSVDATTGEWKINTSPTVNYNSNGFFILKDGNTGTDHSGNSETFSSGGGTLTKTEDCPSNVFCTMAGHTVGSYATLSAGNTKAVGNSASDSACCIGNLGMTNGKYYYEMKVSEDTTNVNYPQFWAVPTTNSKFGHQGLNGGSGNPQANYVGMNMNNGYYNFSAFVSGTTGTSSNGDIIMFAFDMDNGAWYAGRNGTWFSSANPASGASKTGALFTWTADGRTLVPGCESFNNSSVEWNFGNGYFGTTAVYSAGTNASGNGIHNN